MTTLSGSTTSDRILRIKTEKKSLKQFHYILQTQPLNRLSYSWSRVPKLLRRGCKIRDRKAYIWRKLGESCCVVTGLCTGEILFFSMVGRQLCESCRAVTGVWWPRAATSILIQFSQKIKIKFNLKTIYFKI